MPGAREGAGGARSARRTEGRVRRRPERVAALAVVGVVAAVTAARLLPRVAVPSLWFDDQWVALVVRDMGWFEYLRAAPPFPPGAFAAWKLVGALVPDAPATSLVWAVVCCVGAAVTTAWAARRLGAPRCLALAAALVAVNPLLATYALRAKPYTQDAWVAVALLGLGAPLLRAWSRARAHRLGAAGLILCVFSFPSVFVGASLLHVAVLRRLWRTRHGGLDRGALALVGAFDAGLAAVYFGLLRRFGARRSLRDYWADAAAPADSAALPGWLAERTDAFGSVVAGPLPVWAAAGALAAAVLVWSTRARTRWQAAWVVGFYGQLYVAGGLGLYPLGTGRLDLFAAPVTCAVALAGLDALARRAGRRLGRRAAGPARQRLLGYGASALGLAALVGLWTPVAYRPYPTPPGRLAPPVQDARVIREAARRIGPDDGLVVYPTAALAVALYGPWPNELVASPDVGHGFTVRLDRPRSLVLAGPPGFRERPRALLGPQLDAFLAADPPDRLVLVATHLFRGRGALRALDERLARAGYRVASARRAPMAVLVEYVRPPPTDGGR